MKKKVLAALLATMMVASLTACGSKRLRPQTQQQTPQTEETTDTAAEDTGSR